MMFAGNREAINYARDEIIKLLKDRGKFRSEYFDMEPFEILVEIIRSGRFSDVGGPPQLAKIYRSGNSHAFGFRWDTKPNSNVAVLGRPLFAGERVTVPLIDPDNIEFRSEKLWKKEIKNLISLPRLQTH